MYRTSTVFAKEKSLPDEREAFKKKVNVSGLLGSLDNMKTKVSLDNF